MDPPVRALTHPPARACATLTLLAPLLLSCSENATTLIPPVVPVTIEMVSGNGQSGPPGALLDDPLVARVLDGGGTPVNDVEVSWEVSAGGGSLSETSDRTNADGRVQARWTLGANGGDQGVSVRAEAIPPTHFTATAVVQSMEWPPVSELPRHVTPPDPLVTFDGRPVTSPAQWARERRPELRSLFEHYMYGTAPPAPTNTVYTTVLEKPVVIGGVAATMTVTSVKLGPASAPPFSVLLIVPEDRDGPIPVILKQNEVGNHALLPDPDLAISDAWGATLYGRGEESWDFRFDDVLSRGFAGATFYSGEFQPDTSTRPARESLTIGGIHPHYVQGGGEDGEYTWRTIAVWAWAYSRVVDFLLTRPELDPDGIVVSGHSRFGKAALLAGAFDDRIAVTTSVQSGTGGAAPSRTTVGQTLAELNSSFPWWFPDLFQEFSFDPARLPFDQHGLIAMVAPRPLLLLNATDDWHANSEEQFDMLVAASPVYELLGAGPVSSTVIPPVDVLLDSRLSYWWREGVHGMYQEEWDVLLDFAERELPRLP